MTIADAALLAPPVAPTADFRDVLAHLASGVAIVSCWHDGEPRGLLVSSITGLSVEPPRFLFCIRKEARCHHAFAGQSTVSVALLGQDDHEEALRFSHGARSAERFQDARWRLASDAPPIYRGGVARATCTVDTVVDAQTHSLFIVSAHAFDLAPAPPLVAWNRSLVSVG